MEPSDVSAAILALVTGSTQLGNARVNGIFEHAAQGLNTINSNLIHQHGGVGDDPGLIAALQTAAGAPKQGAISAP